MYEKPKFEVFEIRLSESIASDIDSCRPQLGITVQQGGRNNIKVDKIGDVGIEGSGASWTDSL